MPAQLNNTHGHVRVCTVLVTHGNVGRASCLRADVQRPNGRNVNGDRPQVLNSRRPERHTQTAGGRTARDSTTSQTTSHASGALAQAIAREKETPT